MIQAIYRGDRGPGQVDGRGRSEVHLTSGSTCMNTSAEWPLSSEQPGRWRAREHRDSSCYCVGDISHHISQSTFNMCKDDVIMACIEAATEVMQSTLNRAVSSFKNEYQPLSLATGAAACAVERILELDGFNAPMVVDLLTKRFHNFVQLYPTRSAAAELHNCDFMDMIYRGWKIMDPGSCWAARKAGAKGLGICGRPGSN